MDTLKSSPHGTDRHLAGKHSRRQEGFILIMTLVILVIITLSSMAMMASARASISASGNIAFRQAAVRVADVAIEDAFQWVAAQVTVNPAALDASSVASGYYSTATEVDSGCVPSGVSAFSPVTYDFADSNCAKPLASQIAGYSLSYVIHRMAAASGACPGAGCMAPVLGSATTDPDAGDSQSSDADQFTAAAASGRVVYYRITVKVAGPRRNNRFVQAFVY